MTVYEFCLGLGFLGLAIMALSGFFARGPGHDNDVSNVPLAGHQGGHALGPATQAAGAHGGASIVPVGARAGGGLRAGGARGGALRGAGGRSGVGRRVLGWLSPRVMFSVLVGAGAAGMLLHSALSEPLRALVALALGVLFEVALVGPMWRFVMGFGSAPARTLDQSLMSEARAETGFDANGQGLISIELDGQVVQVLGTLRREDREAHVRVRAGDRLLVEDVDGVRNRCTVSRRDP